MTIKFNSIQSDTIAGLVAAVNAFLAPFTVGSAVKILGFDITLADLDRYKGIQFCAMITYDDDASAADQTDPYVLTIFDEGNSADLITTVTAWLLTHVADFVTGIRNVTFTNNPSRLQRLDAWGISCADATNGPTNWTLV